MYLVHLDNCGEGKIYSMTFGTFEFDNVVEPGVNGFNCDKTLTSRSNRREKIVKSS